MANEINIYGKLHAATSAGIIAGADEVFDSNLNKFQSEINEDVDSALGDKVDKEEGKGLSTNDYSNTDKSIVESVGEINKPTFGGLEISQGPLYYGADGYEIKDSWNYSSYDSVYGKNSGSTYFDFVEMGQLFEKADFSTSDGDIENLLDPFDGWRLPTKAEFEKLITTDSNVREGSTVNGTQNAHWAFIQLVDVDHGTGADPVGLLLFPDGKVIEGLDVEIEDVENFTDNVTEDDLNEFLAQGCVFLPTSGYYLKSDGWDGLEIQGYYWSSTDGANTLDAWYLGISSDGIASNTDAKVDDCYTVRLVRDYTQKTVADILNEKVDKEEGMGLSSNDYTTEEKTKLSKATIETINVTYTELCILIEEEELIPGQTYRITDYVTKVKTSTEYISAEHPFDLIVTAISTDSISERASAVLHPGDTYFIDCNLSAWQIWYTIRDDSERYTWNGVNGKGVIYRMIDEYGNDLPYDFKNIMFARYELSNPVAYVYDDGEGDYVIDQDQSLTLKYGHLKTGPCAISRNFNSIGVKKYDGNIGDWLYKIFYTASEEPTYYYTFTYKLHDTQNIIDATIDSELAIKNVVKPYVSGSYTYKVSLNNIVFVLEDDYSRAANNIFEVNCRSCTFRSAEDNTFKNAYYVTAGSNFVNNVLVPIGDERSIGNVTFGSGCYGNKIKGFDVVLGDDCISNEIHKSCEIYDITEYIFFGKYCSSNYLDGGGNIGITLEDNSDGNHIGAGSAYSAIQGSENTIGTNCMYIELYNANGCNIGYNNNAIRFGDANGVRGYYRNVVIESGNNHIYFNTSSTTATGVRCQNIKICSGVNDSNTWKEITDTGGVLQKYQTTYQAANSQIINV